jgi:hypothetical protein
VANDLGWKSMAFVGGDLFSGCHFQIMAQKLGRYPLSSQYRCLD